MINIEIRLNGSLLVGIGSDLVCSALHNAFTFWDTELIGLEGDDVLEMFIATSDEPRTLIRSTTRHS